MQHESASQIAGLTYPGALVVPREGRAEPTGAGRHAHALSGRLPQIDVLSEIADIDDLATDWRDLEKRCAAPAFFQSFGWCRYVIGQLSAFAGSDRRAPLPAVRIATARDGGRLIAVWPLSLSDHLGGRFLTGLGAPFDQYGEILIDADADAGIVIAGFVDRLRQDAAIDGLMVRKVRAGGAMEQLAALGATLVDEGNAAPWLSFEPGQSFDEFQKRINAKTRKNLRNLNNRLGKLGRLEHRVVSGEDIPAALLLSFERRQDWLQAQGLSSSAFRDPRFRAIVAGLAQPEAPALGLTVFALYLDEEIIALQWGFIHQGRYYAFLSAKDPAYDDYSAGRVHLEHVLKTCHELGVRDIDLLVPAVPYKMTWAEGAASVRDAYWGWTPKGRIILELFMVRARPALKRTIAHLPDGMRRLLFRAASGQH